MKGSTSEVNEHPTNGGVADVNDLAKPIKAVEEKWKLLPHFLRLRGLMRQHIDSFDYFVNVEIKKIVSAQSNCEIRSEADRNFMLRYTDIYVGQPSLPEGEHEIRDGKGVMSVP